MTAAWRLSRWLLIASLALLLPGLLAACGRRSDQTELRFWVMGYEGEIVAQLLPEFERQHPGIKVRLQQMPVLSAHEKLLTAYAGDGLPDVTPLGNTWIPEFAELNALEPLDARIAATAGFDQPDFYAGAWDSGVIGGETYAVPWYVETRIPFYRTDIIRDAGVRQLPRNWEQWRAAMHAVKRHVGDGRYAILLPLNEFEPLLNLAIHDPLLRDGDRYGNFRSTGVKQTLTFYKSIFDEKLAPRVANTQISNVWDEFGKGLFSWYVSGPWNIAEFRKRLPERVANDWMTMPLPGPEGPGASVAGGTSFVIFRSSRHKDAAWKLINYLSSPQVQVRFNGLTGNLPSRRSPWNDPALANDRYAKAFRDQLERAVPTPKVPEWERIATELKNVGELLANDRLTVDQAAAELDRRTDTILEKRRWMLEQRQNPAEARQ